MAARNNLAEKNGLKLDFADRVFDVPLSRSPKSMDNFKAYRVLKQIIAEGNYDIVHCNTPMGGIVGRLASQKARKKGTKVFYTAHGFHFYKGAPKKNWLIYYPIEKYFSRKTDKLITIVGEDFETASSSKFHCPIARIHGVGVDEKRYFPINSDEKAALREKMGFEKNRKIILCIGELLPNKNQSMAIRAMNEIVKKFPDALLLIAGNGPEEGNLKQLITSSGLEKNVTLLGYVTNLEEYQKISDLLVACSIREGLGLNVIEALMTGNPVVLSDNRGHRELIDGGNNGFMVPANDDQGMAKHVVELLENEEQQRALRENAIAFSKLYGFEMVKKELEGIYEL